MRLKLSGELLAEWQKIIDLVARIADVPVGLIMRVSGKDIEVLVSSQTEGNPYHAGEKDSFFGSGLYCEKVIETREKLLVPNALKSEHWSHNPDMKHHLMSYLGFPIRQPDGETFGTICLLDRKENPFSSDITALLEKMRALIEDQLKVQALLGQHVRQLEAIREKNSQLEQLNASLKQSEEKYRFIAENTLDYIWVYNLTQDKFTYANPRIQQILGNNREDILSLKIQDLVMPEYLDSIHRHIQEASRQLRENPASTPVFRNEIRQPCTDGEAVWVEYTARWRANEAGEFEAVGVSRDIEERKRRELEILHLSMHDFLTGIYNRAYFFERAKEEIARADRYQLPMAMIFLDLDHFKSVNDRFGHAVGDETLKSIARDIAAALRKFDVFARYGGEEFVVLMTGTSLAAACSAAEKIRRVVENAELPFKIKMTASLGVAERKPGEPLDDWTRRTDAAQYRAKSSGRNRCVADGEG